LLKWRSVVCGVVIVIGPPFLMAQSTTRAILHSDRYTWLNGSPAPETITIFPNDKIQTQSGHSAKIDAEGSTAVIQPETILQFDGDELVLDHGALQLSTERGMRVRVNCVTVIPLTLDRTEYSVTDADGKVHVEAYKHDVKIHLKAVGHNSREGKSSDVIVREGEKSTRSEHCGAIAKPEEGVSAKGGFLNSTWAKYGGIAAVGLVACLGLCPNEDPISPWMP
jgi:hypothetical protein